MFLVPCAIGGSVVLLFAARLKDRRLAMADRPRWSVREFLGTFYVNPRKSPDLPLGLAWAFASRFMFVLAYAFLTIYQAYCLLDEIGSDEADVPQQVFLGTLTQAALAVDHGLVVVMGRSKRPQAHDQLREAARSGRRCAGRGAELGQSKGQALNRTRTRPGRSPQTHPPP